MERPMRKLLVSAVVSLMALSSLAHARPSTMAMSCDQAGALVASHGAVVLTTGRHTFERFVRSPGYCALGEYAETGWAPTRDASQCVLGYVCRTRPHFREDGWGIFDDFP
jgi:hypothetical protein